MKIDSTPGEDLLPPMPEPEDIYGMSEGYDGTSMEAYGLQCYEAGVAAERERCAKLCEDEKVNSEATGAAEDTAYNAACGHCAAAIRASR